MKALLVALLLLAGQAWGDFPVTSGLVLHLDSSVGVTKDGSDKVSLWADQSGAGNNSWQTGATEQPTWVSNQYDGRPWINFVSSDLLTATASSITGAGARTVMVLQQPFDTAQDDVAFSLGATLTDNTLWAITDTTIYGRPGPNDVTGLASFGNRTGLVPQVNTVTYAGSLNTVNRYVNNTQITVNGASRAWNTNQGYYVGNWVNLDRPFAGAIVEIACFNRVLSQAERELVVNYMLDHNYTTSNQLSPYMRNSNSPNMFPLFLMHLFDKFFVSPAYALESDQRAEQARNTSYLWSAKVKIDKAKLTDDIVKGKVTLTPTPTPDKRAKTPTATPTATPSVVVKGDDKKTLAETEAAK